MFASKNKYLQEASNTIFRLSADEQIRKQCLDREEYYQDLRNYERVIAQKDALLEKALAEKQELLQESQSIISKKEALFPRATSQADMLACPFGDCREGQEIITKKDTLLQEATAETKYLRSLLKTHGINYFKSHNQA